MCWHKFAVSLELNVGEDNQEVKCEAYQALKEEI